MVPDNEQILTTRATRPEADLSTHPPSHGTCVAGKSLGRKYGVSKQAKLVVAKMYEKSYFELIEALKFIVADIKGRPDRKKRSVISMAMTGPRYNEHDPDQKTIQIYLKQLINLDVPIIMGAGNRGKKKGHQEVDTILGVFEGLDFPLIVVGSTSWGGQLRAAPMSLSTLSGSTLHV